MDLAEILSLGIVSVLLLLGLGLLVLVLKQTPRSAAGDLVGQGDFARALEAADTSSAAGRDELFAAAVAAKHLLDLDTAEALLARLVEDDHSDGEAWMERGLVAAYRGDDARARDCLTTAERHRSDLLESISLHRAWADLRAGDRDGARRRFEEISAPLESKLRSDLGPGDPLFAEWFFQAADLWEESGALEKGAWARAEAGGAAPASLLVAKFVSNRL